MEESKISNYQIYLAAYVNAATEQPREYIASAVGTDEQALASALGVNDGLSARRGPHEPRFRRKLDLDIQRMIAAGKEE